MITEQVLKNMLQPKNSKWNSSITNVETDRLITRGYSQDELIGRISFPEMIFLLLNGELPSQNQVKMLQSILVSFCDHGITPPSTQAARTMASAGSSISACLAGGILAFGENHAGAIELSMKMMQKAVNYHESTKDSIDIIANKLVNFYLENGRKVPGFGHRYHKEDPRAQKLIELSKENKCLGKHLELALRMQDLLYDRKGIKMNIDGSNAAILSDMGFDWKIGCGFFAIGRLPGILAHIIEEKNDKPFKKIFDLD